MLGARTRMSGLHRLIHWAFSLDCAIKRGFRTGEICRCKELLRLFRVLGLQSLWTLVSPVSCFFNLLSSLAQTVCSSVCHVAQHALVSGKSVAFSTSPSPSVLHVLLRESLAQLLVLGGGVGGGGVNGHQEHLPFHPQQCITDAGASACGCFSWILCFIGLKRQRENKRKT